MDFKSLLAPLSFRKGPPSGDVPAPLVRRHRSNHRLAAVAEAGQILTALPRPGEALHAIQSGRFDLTDALDVILERLGTALHLRIATLSFNARNVQRMRAWIDSGAVQRLTLLCSKFFVAHYPDLYEEVRQTLAPPHACGAARNHCKVICFDMASGDKLTLEGSANLRTNSNREQFCLIHDPGLHDWHAAWIDSEVARNEGEAITSASPAAR